MKTLTCMRKSTSSRRRQDLGCHSPRRRLCTKTPPWWPENRRVGRDGQLRFGCNRFKLNFF
ncbi:BnaC09g17980D [Brassica napus]|uniref:BnaC09g17980D protein n=2 Tax=Brassica napus TaxID=3708 RepID=A0A078HGM1_BRANA|nr:BnaC09g17980D [Brassica napus]